MKKAKVTGCIVTFNNSDIIQDCISSIMNATADLDFQLYISDNASSDNTLEIIENSFNNVKIIRNSENGGFGHGHNQVIPLEDVDYHFVINPDIIMIPGTIQKLVEYMNNNNDVLMITPKILNIDGSEQLLPKRDPTIRYLMLSKIFPFKKYRKIYTRELEQLSKPTEIEFCTGCFFGIRAETFRKLGGFDPRFFMYMEDADLSRRVRTEGKVIFYPEASVYHKWHRENLRNIKGILRWTCSMVKYFNKWGWKF